MTAAAAIDALLPQIHCRQCGFHGCRPYAEAIAAAEAGIDRCPPGGALTLRALAGLQGVAAPAVPDGFAPATTRYVVQAHACIGCAKCLPQCPTDALVGAPLRLHDILSELCTGCGLCVAVCPVDCIVPVDRGPVTDAERELWRQRYAAQVERRSREERDQPALAEAPHDPGQLDAAIAAAVARQSARRKSPPPTNR